MIGCLPDLLLVAIVGAIPFIAPDLIERCVGLQIDPPRGKAGVIYAITEIVCSPLLLFGPKAEIALFAFLIGVVVLLIYARFWMREHQAYWDVIRAKENARRRQTRLEKKQKRERL